MFWGVFKNVTNHFCRYFTKVNQWFILLTRPTGGYSVTICTKGKMEMCCYFD